MSDQKSKKLKLNRLIHTTLVGFLNIDDIVYSKRLEILDWMNDDINEPNDTSYLELEKRIEFLKVSLKHTKESINEQLDRDLYKLRKIFEDE